MSEEKIAMNVGLKKTIAGSVVAVLGLSAPLAWAQNSVTIGETVFTCQHTCVVTSLGNGSFTVGDSRNGWVVAKRKGSYPVPPTEPK
ncbi:hypothetical protein [Luteimonas mephitis]|uniref:hypothetical protein n=1 Tax=Luteimonas mephitis TaxID=83615 RepID=UPI003A9451C4